MGTFVVTGLFMGRAADNGDRKNIITAGCLIWNLALMGMGMSNSFAELLAFRLILGFGQAFSNPASYSMIADLFEADKRPTANGNFASGMYIGGALASASMNIDTAIGWRATCYLCAIFGGASAVILYSTFKEPARMSTPVKKAAGDESEEKLSAMESMKLIFTNPKVFVLIAAASIRFCGGYAIAGYLPDVYATDFASYSTIYGYLNAWVVGMGSFASSITGGYITSMWVKTEPRANYYVPAIGCVLGCPFITIACLSGNFYVSMLCGLFMEYVVAECWFGPYMASLQASVPARVRGLAVAVMMFSATFFGSLCVLLMGIWYDDCCNGSGDYIKYIVLYTVLVTYLCSAVLFLVASTMSDDVAEPTKGKATTEKAPLLEEGENKA